MLMRTLPAYLCLAGRACDRGQSFVVVDFFIRVAATTIVNHSHRLSQTPNRACLRRGFGFIIEDYSKEVLISLYGTVVGGLGLDRMF